MATGMDPVAETERNLVEVRKQRDDLIKRSLRRPDGLLHVEATLPLTINGMRAVDFVRRAYDLGDDLNGPGRYDMHDPVQAALRRIKDWITMAEQDALNARADPSSRNEKP